MLRKQTDRRQERAGDEQFGQRLDHRARFEANRDVAPHHHVKKQEIRDRHQTGGKRETAMIPAKLKVGKTSSVQKLTAIESKD